jgi:hypothetical protein
LVFRKATVIALSCISVHLLDLARPPRLVKPRFERAVEPGDAEAPKWRYWQHPGQQLPPAAVVNERGEVIEIVAEELPASFSRHIQSWDLAFEGKQPSDFVAGLDIRTSSPKRYIIDAVMAAPINGLTAMTDNTPYQLAVAWSAASADAWG